MFDVLQFIFSSFWVWLGTFILLGMILTAVVKLIIGMIMALKGKDIDLS